MTQSESIFVDKRGLSNRIKMYAWVTDLTHLDKIVRELHLFIGLLHHTVAFWYSLNKAQCKVDNEIISGVDRFVHFDKTIHVYWWLWSLWPKSVDTTYDHVRTHFKINHFSDVTLSCNRSLATLLFFNSLFSWQQHGKYQSPVLINSLHKGFVMQKSVSCHDVIMH